MKKFQALILMVTLLLCVVLLVGCSSPKHNAPISGNKPSQSDPQPLPKDSEAEEKQTEIYTEEKQTEKNEETEKQEENEVTESEETTSAIEKETVSDDGEEVHIHSFGEWETTRKATCSKEGEELRVCVCGEKETRKTDLDYENHNYTSQKISASCLDPGGVQYTCTGCQDEYFEETTDPLGGHKLQITGICTRCEGDYSTDMTSLIGSPHSNSKYGFSFAERIGIAFSWQATNNSGKTIKYCTIQIIFYNSVSDVVKTSNVKITGPFKASETISKVDSVWVTDYKDVAMIEIAYVSLEYTDGSMDAGYYGYSTDYYNEKLIYADMN